MQSDDIVMIFGARFNEFGCDIADLYCQRYAGAKVHALCAGGEKVSQAVSRRLSHCLGEIWDIEREAEYWINGGAELSNAAEIDATLGVGSLGRFLTADREIGAGFITGALLRPSRLAKQSYRSKGAAVNYLSGLYKFLNNLLERKQPGNVFLYAVAGAPALMLAELAEVKDIQFSRLVSARLGSYYVVDKDPRGRLALVGDLYCSKLWRPKPESLEAAEALLHEFREKPTAPTYAITSRTRINNEKVLRLIVKAVLRSIKSGVYRGLTRSADFSSATAAWHDVKIAVKRRQSFDRYTSPLPSSNGYIYYPLHVDPEASTQVLSPMLTDQLAVIEALAKSLPAGTTLVVKDHFPMLGRRPRDFYARIHRMPRVILVSPMAESLSLIRDCSLVATISGTAAWEAMLLGVPALVLGDSPFVRIDSGVVHAASMTDLPKVVRQALDISPASDEELTRYICAILELGFQLDPQLLWGDYQGHAVTDRERAVRRIVDRIC